MLIETNALRDFRLDSLDGEIGTVRDLYFDDQRWMIRYLVADTGGWLADRLVLISPHALAAISRQGRHIATNLTRQQIEGSPAAETDKPVSRQFETDYHQYYSWPAYWSGAYAWGPLLLPTPDPALAAPPTPDPTSKPADPHLRSVNEMIGYRVQASDGDIGQVADCILDDETWTIRYLVIDTRNWWVGNLVLIAPRWIDQVSWSESTITVALTCADIRRSPEYSPQSLLTRNYEDSLHRHYQRPGYWLDETLGK